MAHKIFLPLDVFSPTPLYQQLCTGLEKAISEGRLSPGEKLPSIRELSKQLQISTVTVRLALDRLVDSGLVTARHGSGNYVSRNLSIQPAAQSNVSIDCIPTSENMAENFSPPTEAPKPAPVTAIAQEYRRIQEALTEYSFDPKTTRPMKWDFRALGEPAVDLMSGPRWQETLMRWSREKTPIRGEYSDARGLPELRQAIAAWLNSSTGIQCSPDDIFIVSGAQQSRDIIAKLLVSAGTNVLVEEPGSITALLTYQAQGAQLTHISQDEQGLNIERLERIESSCVLHTMPSANFPTSRTLPKERRERILDWAEKTDSLIVEDAFGSAYCFGKIEPPIYSLAQQRGCTDRVIYHGSLSQLLMPDLRLGFAIIPAWLQKAYFRAKWLADRHCSMVAQELVVRLFQDGFFEDHLLRTLQTSRKRRETLLTALRSWPQDLASFTPVQAGFQQPIWFAEGIDDKEIFEAAAKEGIGVVPLSAYFHASRPQPGLSLNFIRMHEENIREGMAKLLQVILAVRQGQAELAS